MYVIKRNGTEELVYFDKIQERLLFLASEPTLLEHVNTHVLAKKVIENIYNNIRTSDIDVYAAELSESMSIEHVQYNVLAGRIIINNHHKNTLTSFKDKIELLHKNKDINGKTSPLINDMFYKYVIKNQKFIEDAIVYERDYSLDFFAFRTLEKSYLLKTNLKKTVKITDKGEDITIDGDVVERPQDMFMRVAIGIHVTKNWKCKTTLDLIIETYNFLSRKLFTHATPTLFNAGMPIQGLASCFLLGTADSQEGILKPLCDASRISKACGGVGFWVHDWRAAGSYIRGTGGFSLGIIPFLKEFDQASCTWKQGNKRSGSFAVYLEPHHADIMDFLNLKLNTMGDEKKKARNLWLGLWVSDLFMERVRDDGIWSVFCPDECPGLSDVYGDEYKKLYLRYESEGKARKKYKIRDVWSAIHRSCVESGVPYICYKDKINKCSNQKNIGVIKSSNLCVSGDTMILTDKGYYPIKELSECEKPIHKVWNGEAFTDAVFRKTGEDQELLEIETTHGNIIKCTKYHKFILSCESEEMIVEANELKEGDSIIKNEFPVIDHGEEFKNDLNNKFTVPINYNLQSKLKWLGELLDTDGFLESRSENSLSLLLRSVELEFLQNVKLLCNTLGVNPIISKVKCRPSYRLLFNSYDTNKLYKIGLKTHRLIHNGAGPNRDARSFNKIKSIRQLEKREDTYCFNEPLKHRGIFQGVILGQCVEIMEASSTSEYACCTLASIGLPMFVKDINNNNDSIIPNDPMFDYAEFQKTIEIIVRNLNRVIDINYYPVPEAEVSNMRHRPLGIGVQGLADVFLKFNTYFGSEESKSLNKYIFETLYYTALSASAKLSREIYMNYVKQLEAKGKVTINKIEYTAISDIPTTVGAYSTFIGSPLSQGIFHFEMYDLKEQDLTTSFDWESLRQIIMKFGVRNSLLIALMPTASTSQILGNTECIEPIASNVFVRGTLAGEFLCINKYLIHDLEKIQLWNRNIENQIKHYGGSIQNINVIPNQIKQKYKTIWEISPKVLIDLAADRSPFVDQSQSLNLSLADPTLPKFTQMHFYGWKRGLKTGCYYLRTRPSYDAQKFTVDSSMLETDEANDTLEINESSIEYIEQINRIKINKPNDDCLVCQS